MRHPLQYVWEMRTELMKNQSADSEARGHNCKEVQWPDGSLPEPCIAGKTVAVALDNIKDRIQFKYSAHAYRKSVGGPQNRGHPDQNL